MTRFVEFVADLIEASDRVAAWVDHCRCCGKPIRRIDGHPIHTGCISKHWGKHCYGVNASRCHEFKHLPKKVQHEPFLSR